MMNRRKSIVGTSVGAFSSPEKKSRGGFPFRRAESSRDGHYVPTPSPSLPEERAESSRSHNAVNTSTTQDEIPTSVERDTPVLTNGTTEDHQQATAAPAEAKPQVCRHQQVTLAVDADLTAVCNRCGGIYRTARHRR